MMPKCTVVPGARLKDQAKAYPAILDGRNGDGLHKLEQLPMAFAHFAFRVHASGGVWLFGLDGELKELFRGPLFCAEYPNFMNAFAGCRRIECVLDVHRHSEDSLVFSLVVRLFRSAKQRIGPEFEVRVDDTGSNPVFFFDHVSPHGARY